MLGVLFGDIHNGRLQRLHYLGWYVALSVLVLLGALGIGVGIGIAERAVGGGIAEAQALVVERVGTIGLISIAAVFALLLFANVNIAAKRVRDMGLPGWWVVLGVFAAGVLAASLGQQVSTLWTLATALALLLIPTDAFGGHGAAPPRTPAA